MRKRLVVLFLLGSFAGFASSSAGAQIFETGPAGLSRQMPRIYGPHMANRSRLINQRKMKQRSTQHNKARRQHRVQK